MNKFSIIFFIIRSKTISLRKYFGMLTGILIIPLIYCFSLGWLYYPVDGRKYFDYPAVAEILDLNISQKILLAGALMFTFTTYYIIFACTLAYSIICVLGWRMHKLVKNRRKFGGRQQEMVNEMNRQKNRNLLIQACLPLTIYIPLLFILFIQLFGINVKMISWIQYYYMLSIDPMWFPPALNPIVTILTISPYRKVFIKSIHMLTKLLCCQSPPAASMHEIGDSFNSSGNYINNNNNNRIIPHQILPTMNGWTHPS